MKRSKPSKDSNILIAAVILVVSLVLIVVLRQSAAASELSISGTTDWSDDLTQRLAFLKVETQVDGEAKKVFIKHSLDGNYWEATAMTRRAGGRYVGVIPNNYQGEVMYYIEAFGHDGQYARAPEVYSYISSVPFKSLRKQIPKSRNYQGKTIYPLHKSYNYGYYPVIVPLQ